VVDFEEMLTPRGAYRLEDVSLLVATDKVRFRAVLLGPAGAEVWARAWISDENGTLAETAAPSAVAGDQVTIDVATPQSVSGCHAFIRIESKPLETEHVLMRRLP